MQGNVYLLAGAGGNTVVQVGASGAIVVDSKTAAQAERILAEAPAFARPGARVLLEIGHDHGERWQSREFGRLCVRHRSQRTDSRKRSG